jgi:O-antigen ligase
MKAPSDRMRQIPLVLTVSAAAVAGLGIAIVESWWPAVLGVLFLAGMAIFVTHGKTSWMVAFLVFLVTLLTCLTISAWAPDGAVGHYASLCRYALTGLLGSFGAVMLLTARTGRLTWFDFGWLGLLGSVAVSALYSIASSVSLGRGVPLAAFFLCLFALTRVMKADPRCPVRVLDSVIAASVCFLLPGTVLAFIRTASVFPGGRYAGSFGSASALGGFCCIVLPVALWGARHHRRAAMRMLYSWAVAIMVPSLLLSQVRNAIGAFLLGLVVVYLYRRRRNLILLAPVFALLAAIAVGAVYHYSEALTATSFFDEYVDRKGTLETATGRFILWQEALDKVAERPLAGYGYGTGALALWSANLPSYLRVESRDLASYADVLPFLNLNVSEGLAVHNSFLGVLLELGIPGALAFAVMVGSVLVGLTHVDGRALVPEYRHLPAFLAGALTAGLVNAAFESGLLYPGGLAFLAFWLVVAVLRTMPTRPLAGNSTL